MNSDITDHDDALVDELTRRLKLLTQIAAPSLLCWIEETGVSVPEARLLVALMDHPDARMTAGELAEATGLPVDEAARAAGALRGRGLTRDARRRVVLTDRGREAVAALERVREEGLRAYLAAMPRAQREQLARSLRELSA